MTCALANDNAEYHDKFIPHNLGSVNTCLSPSELGNCTPTDNAVGSRAAPLADLPGCETTPVSSRVAETGISTNGGKS